MESESNPNWFRIESESNQNWIGIESESNQNQIGIRLELNESQNLEIHWATKFTNLKKSLLSEVKSDEKNFLNEKFQITR